MIHDTFTIEKTYSAAPASIFKAFATKSRKAEWYATSPSHECISYELDFREGGEEKLTAKMREGTPIAGMVLCWTSDYAKIVVGEKIVFFQTLDVAENRVSAAVISVEFADGFDGGSAVTLTHQSTYFDGADGPEMRKMGWESLLDAAAAATSIPAGTA